jgi:hypothetical protein
VGWFRPNPGETLTVTNSRQSKQFSLRRLDIAVFLLLSFFVGRWCFVSSPAPLPPIAPRQAVYVWQRHWQPAVATAVTQASTKTDEFWVLAAEVEESNGVLQTKVAQVEWQHFQSSEAPLWIVFRAHRLPGLENPSEQRAMLQFLSSEITTVLQSIHAADVSVAGLQIDYDCPTSKLLHYAALLRGLSEQFPELPLSITALPTWCTAPAFAEVIQGLDHFVLQVHCLEAPARLEDPATLCDTTRIPDWLTKAAAFGVPFYVALPTYGYELLFKQDGEFYGVRAEEPQERYENLRSRNLYSDPVEIAGVVRDLQNAPPPHWIGFAWFRLPVEGDRLNWRWPVLQSVMNGDAPPREIHGEIRNPQPGLWEVWIKNKSGYHAKEPISVPVYWTQGALVVSDVVGGFQWASTPQEDGGRLTGSAPAPGEERMAAWIRLVEDEGMKISLGDMAVGP